MKVNVQYFAALREKAGRSLESIETRATSYRDLYDELQRGYGFPVPAALVKVAVGQRFASMDDPIEDGATVVFIPPVAGG